MTEQSEDDSTDDGPSKSLRKRQSHDLQALGEALIELPQAELDVLPLPDVLRDAVLLARRITKHGGLSRQKQFIGKLMRKIDAEPIRVALEARRQHEQNAARQFHLIERWRRRLIDEGDAIEEFVRAFPGADRASVIRLTAQARRERDDERPPKATRELFAVVEKVVKRTESLQSPIESPSS